MILSDEHKEIQMMAAKFSDGELAPIAADARRLVGEALAALAGD